MSKIKEKKEKSKPRVRGFYTAQIKGRDGKVRKTIRGENGITNIGKNDLLDAAFHNQTQRTVWFIAPIDDASFVQLADTDTMAAHGGWVENQDYSEGTRQEWTEGAAANEQITNAVSVDFSINATVTLKGFFVTSDNTKGGAAGILWATALFDDGDEDVVSGETLSITYTIAIG